MAMPWRADWIPEPSWPSFAASGPGSPRARAGRCTCSTRGLGFLGGHGIVGGQIPLAAGVAFAAKYQNQSSATLCFFGEAAVNIGSFHEALNLAQLWKLPVVFICENNGFGMGTPIEKTSAVRDPSRKQAPTI